jgi:hypothetical protein
MYVARQTFTDVSEEHTAVIFSYKRKLNNQQDVSASLALLFDPENGGSTYFRNVGKLLPDYIALSTARL